MSAPHVGPSQVEREWSPAEYVAGTPARKRLWTLPPEWLADMSTEQVAQIYAASRERFNADVVAAGHDVAHDEMSGQVSAVQAKLATLSERLQDERASWRRRITAAAWVGFALGALFGVVAVLILRG